MIIRQIGAEPAGVRVVSCDGPRTLRPHWPGCCSCVESLVTSQRLQEVACANHVHEWWTKNTNECCASTHSREALSTAEVGAGASTPAA